MCVRRLLCFSLLLQLWLTAFAPPAAAGAFLQPLGEGEIITATSFSDTTRAFDASGKLLPVRSYKKFELGTYIEYGLTQRVTLVVKSQGDYVRQSGQTSPPLAASGDIGARVGLAHWGGTVLSMQGLAHLPFGSVSKQSALFDENRASGADLRLLLGHGFSIAEMPAFLDVEASHSWRGAAMPQEWHADVTFGIRLLPQVLAILASYMTMAGNTAAGCRSWSNCWMAVKLKPGVVYDFSRHWSGEISFFATVAGQDEGRELGPMAALWYRF